MLYEWLALFLQKASILSLCPEILLVLFPSAHYVRYKGIYQIQFGFLLFWRAVDSDEYNEPTQANTCLLDTKWICSDFETNVHAAGAGDYTKPHSRSANVS